MTNLKRSIMLRVYAIRVMRPFVSTSALCVVLALVSVYAVSREVWVAMVFRNMPSPSDLGAFMSFFVSAFIHTGLMVQAFCVLATVATVFLARELARTLAVLVPVRA